MKDFFKKMSVVCFGLLAALSLAGCSSSSNDEEKSNKNASEEDHIATSAEATYVVSVGKNTLEFYNVEIEYVDTDNEKKKVTMTDTLWTKKLTLDEKHLPIDLELRTFKTVKDGISIDPDRTYNIGFRSKIPAKAFNKYGRMLCEISGHIDVIGYPEHNDIKGSEFHTSIYDIISDLFFGSDKKTLRIDTWRMMFNDMPMTYK